MDRVTILLADGRRLAYAQYGPPEGRPVVACHGTPGSRLEHAAVSALHEMGVRLIVVDRPGYGLSDFQPGRRLLDWPDDVVQLADELQLDRFSILGFSGGGPHAAACASSMSQRIDCLALISSMAPLDATGVAEAMLPANRALFELAASDYRQLEQQLSTIATTPEVLLDLLEGPAPAADKAVFAKQDFRRMYTTSLAESVRQGITGLAYDMSLLAQPWGFDPAMITSRVYLWQGEQDINAPAAMGRYLANTIQGCNAHFIPDAGHYLMFSHWVGILQEIMREH